jgi:hypothetical protein
MSLQFLRKKNLKKKKISVVMAEDLPHCILACCRFQAFNATLPEAF